METTAPSVKAASSAVTDHTKAAQVSAYWKEMDNGRFAYTPMILLAIAIIGGMGAAFALQMNIWALLVIVLPTMVCFCMILAIMPMKLIVRTALIAVFIDLIFVAVGTVIQFS